MTKHRICTLCAALLITLCLGGCGKQQAEASEPLVLEVYDSLSEYEGMQQGWYAALLRQKFNIELRFLSKEEKQERDLLTPLGEGQVPDLILYSGKDGDLNKMVEAGNLLDMEELLPGTEIAEYKDALKSLNEAASEDGIYGVPGQVSRLSPETPAESVVPQYGVYLRWDIYSQAGYPAIKDMDGLLDVMEQMQEIMRKDGSRNVYAISLFKEGDDSVLGHASQIAGLFGYGRQGFIFAEPGGKKYEDVRLRESWLGEACEWLRKAYERGLVDPDSFTQTKEEADGKYRDGRAFLTFYPETGVKYSSSSGNLPKGQGMELAPVKGLKVLSKGCNPLGRRDWFLALGREVEHPERVMEFLDWWYSPEGIMISGAGSGGTAGILGLTWDVEDGNPVLTEFGQKVFSGEDQDMPEEWGDGTWLNGVCRLEFAPVVEVEVSPSGFTYSYRLWDTFEEQEDNPLARDWKDFMQADDAIEYLMNQKQLKVIPGYISYTEEEPARITELRTAALKTTQSFFPRLIKAPDEDKFDSLYQDLNEKLNTPQYTEVLQYDLELLE